MFYRPICRGPKKGTRKGFPLTSRARSWCKHLKTTGDLYHRTNVVQYVGIAADELNRFGNLTEIKKSPPVEVGWTEAMCREWCEKNDLLSPIYTTATRGGCWFCHNQGVNQLRLLRKNYPEYWALILKWDEDSPVSFKAAIGSAHSECGGHPRRGQPPGWEAVSAGRGRLPAGGAAGIPAPGRSRR